MSLWERITQRLHPSLGRAARDGGIRISREMAYGIAPFLEANVSPEANDPDAQVQELHRLLYDTRRDMIAPSLATSELFLVAVCDMAYLGGSVLVRRNGHAMLDQLAVAAGVERQRLELMLLPSCGLGDDVRFADSQGNRYAVALGFHHKALLRDERGRMRTGVPRGFSSEERGRLARYRALVNQKGLAQRRRLELAMLTGQRWDAELFAQMLAHPLLAHHARHLLWAGYDAAGNLIEGFLVQDDGALMSDAYGAVDLACYAMVGIPHPANAPVDRVLAWSELMDDFHVAPLFLQLHRPVYRPSDVALAVAASFASARWGASFLFMTLGHMGWDMLVPSQMFEYALPNMPVRAVLDLRVEGIAARPLGLRFEREGLAVPQAEIPPSLASEVCWQMARLAANPNLIVP